MSERCRRSKGVQIESLHHWDQQDQQWQEALVEDKNVTPAELAASRIDFPAWLATLRTRDCRDTGDRLRRQDVRCVGSPDQPAPPRADGRLTGVS